MAARARGLAPLPPCSAALEKPASRGSLCAARLRQSNLRDASSGSPPSSLLPPTYTHSSPKSLFCRLYSLRVAAAACQLSPPRRLFNFNPGGGIRASSLSPPPSFSCLFATEHPRSPAPTAFPLRAVQINPPILAIARAVNIPPGVHQALQLPVAALVSPYLNPGRPKAPFARVGAGSRRTLNSTDDTPRSFIHPRPFGRSPAGGCRRSQICLLLVKADTTRYIFVKASPGLAHQPCAHP